MKSPLNSYASGGRGEIYVSSVGAIQQAVGAVQGAINSYVNEDASHKADRLAGRVENRKNRLSHKDEEDKNSEYYKKTERITARAADSKSEARNNQQTEIERLKKENEAYRNKYKA
jgi:hypothetical protein|tara:strand:+ start:199 stop:546 length:348 start_codon:yes stop_codon:yes gene_type:complete